MGYDRVAVVGAIDEDTLRESFGVKRGHATLFVLAARALLKSLGFVNLSVGFTVSRLFIATDYKSKCPLNFRELYILHSTSLPFCWFSL